MFYIEKLKLTNFRCYKDKRINFKPHVNIIVGENAVGKTSLVEAIYCLGLTKSYKASKDSFLIKHDQPFYVLEGEFVNQERKHNVLLSYEIDKSRKRLLVDNNVVKKLSDYIGTFKVVMFSPDDSELIKGYSPQRRRFLDIYLGQINNKYLKDLSNYNKVLKNRNELLKQTNQSEQDLELLKIYSEALVKYGKNLIIEREKFINMLNPEVAKISLAISNGEEKTELKYMPNVENEEFMLKTFRQLKKDLYLQTTGLGPHKDDFLFTIKGVDAASFASQGQQRTSSIALKLGLASLFDKLGLDNIVILDDVFSELDKGRQNEIMKLFKNNKQIFITTTTIKAINEELLESSNVIKIEREEKDEWR